ncbi:MAG: hypothetical protein QM757_33290 [Paludibaculum sp.]
MNAKVRLGVAVFFAIAFIVLINGACGIDVVAPNRPPANIPAAMLYSRPKETFWVVCTPHEGDVHNCDFYNLDGRSIAFRCNYAFPVQPTQKTLAGAWLGVDRKLKLDNGTAIECLDRVDAPSFR